MSQIYTVGAISRRKTKGISPLALSKSITARRRPTEDRWQFSRPFRPAFSCPFCYPAAVPGCIRRSRCDCVNPARTGKWEIGNDFTTLPVRDGRGDDLIERVVENTCYGRETLFGTTPSRRVEGFPFPLRKFNVAAQVIVNRVFKKRRLKHGLGNGKSGLRGDALQGFVIPG